MKIQAWVWGGRFSFLLGLLPFAWLVQAVMTAKLGPDPAKAVVDFTGLWAVRWLLACLSLTPIRILTGQGKWLQYRRMLGLYALFYATMHLVSYIFLLMGADFTILAKELTKRPYILAGFAAWLILVPLGMTSTRKWQARLGRKWKELHRLVYLAAITGLLHFIWLKKTGIWAVWPYALWLLVLFVIRWSIVQTWIGQKRQELLAKQGK